MNNQYLPKVRSQLNKLFARSEQFRWSYAEESFLSEISTRSEVMEELLQISQYRERQPQFFPRSIKRLLETWTEILDRIGQAPIRQTEKPDHRAERRAKEYPQTIHAKKLT